MNNEMCFACFKPLGNSLHEVQGYPCHKKCEKLGAIIIESDRKAKETSKKRRKK